MRIRKEIEHWNWRRFFTLYAFIIIFNGTFYILAYARDLQFFLSPSFWINLGAMPLLLASGVTFSARNITLFINDYETIPDFRSVLLKHTLSKNLAVQHETEHLIVFKPTNWFYRMANAWGKTELVELRWGTEITISGPTHRIQQIEDSLIWNKDFKTK